MVAVVPALNQGVGYGVVVGLGIAFALGKVSNGSKHRKTLLLTDLVQV